MGLFSKKEKNNGIDENSLPVNVTFSDGSTILAMDPVDTGVKIKHSDGRRYALMMFDVSNYAKEGETVYFNPFNKVVVEKALNPDGTCQPLTRDEVTSYAVEYVRQLITGNTDPNKICQYIGRLDERTGDMIISQTVKNDVNTRLEESVRNEIKARNEAKRIQSEMEAAKQKEEFLAQAARDHKAFLEREEKVRAQRIASERFDCIRSDTDSDGKHKLLSYDGVDLDSGDVLRVRDLCKIGKDPEGNYLYTANVSTTYSENDVEFLEPHGGSVAFTTKTKITDLVQTPAGKRKVLELFAMANRESRYGDGLKFIGSLDQTGTLVSKDIKACSNPIQEEFGKQAQKVEARQRRMEEKYRQANQRGGDDREI